MTYEIIVAGVVVRTVTGTYEEAEKVLDEARASVLGWVHAPETFRIHKV